MTKSLFPLLLVFFSLASFAQSTSASYEDKRGNLHLLGEIDRSALEKPPFQEWFETQYDRYEVSEEMLEKINAFYSDDVTVKVFLGTWCGDSKREVTRFLKIVDHCKMPMSKVTLFGLDGRLEHIKQGPNGEEKGLNIHRVPTFIFYKSGQEIGRIVESPRSSLEKEIAQIYAGLASEPNYYVANYIMNLFQEKPIDEVDTLLTKKARYFKHKSSGEGELNTLGYVLLNAGQKEKAVVVFKLNTLLFPQSGNTFDSLGEAYMEKGNLQLATENYMKSYQLNPNNTNALLMIQKMLRSNDHG